MTLLSAGNWIHWIAMEAKINDKHGLDVELIFLRGTGQTSSAMLGGRIFASPVALPTVMLAKPEIRNRKPEEFVDASFIAELDKSGSIRKLYEAR